VEERVILELMLDQRARADRVGVSQVEDA
jgi:hypothetical protein